MNACKVSGSAGFFIIQYMQLGLYVFPQSY